MARRKNPTITIEPDEVNLLIDAVNAYGDIVKEDVEEFGDRPASDLEIFERLSKKIWKLDPRTMNLARRLSE